MPDVTISYKDSQIASMDASGTKTLLTEGKYCEDDIVVQYTRYSPEVYAGEHHQPTPSSYTVTVSLTNPSGISKFGGVTIYEALSNDATIDPIQSHLVELGTITSATGSATVTVSSTAYGVYVDFDGNYVGSAPQSATKTCTGGVALASGYEWALVFSVTGNGTATIDGVDWEYDW